MSDRVDDALQTWLLKALSNIEKNIFDDVSGFISHISEIENFSARNLDTAKQYVVKILSILFSSQPYSTHSK